MTEQKKVRLAECPPGLFVFRGILGFKSEYGPDAYVVESGEYFWGGTTDHPSRAELLVVPVEPSTVLAMSEAPTEVAHLVGKEGRTLCGLTEWVTGNVDIAFGIKSGNTTCVECLRVMALNALKEETAPTERRFTLEEVEKALRADRDIFAFDVDTIVAEVRSRLLAPKPVERVVIKRNSIGNWNAYLDGVQRPKFSFTEEEDAETFAAGLRAELAKQEGA